MVRFWHRNVVQGQRTGRRDPVQLRFLRGAALIVVLTSAGCAHDVRTDRAFTDEWVIRNERLGAFEERKARLAEDELVLVGKKDSMRAAVEMDEKGRPRLNVGKDRGVSADVNVDTDSADVKLKYKWRW